MNKKNNLDGSKNNEKEKSDIDKEIEAELLEYLNSEKKEDKVERKKYKTPMFFAMLIIAILYLYKFSKHLMFIDLLFILNI